MSAVLTLAGQWVAAGDELPALADWLADRHGSAVRIAPGEQPDALAPHLVELRLIGIEFPRFTDGRGYSLATDLRRAGFKGELRALGDVLIDQIFLLKRVGFTQFALREDQDRAAAVAALTRFSDFYQGAADQPLPLYRRVVRPRPGADA